MDKGRETQSGKRLRVLLVADVSPTQVIGGAERVLYEHMSRLAREGHAVHCLTKTEEKEENVPNRIGGGVLHCFRGVSNSTALFFVSFLWRCRRKFKYLLRDNTFDIINFHQPLSAMGVLTVYKSWNIPRVYTFHSLWFQEYEIRITKDENSMGFFKKTLSLFWIQLNIGLRRIIERVCLKAANQIIVLSDFSKEQLIKYHRVPASKISLIPGGVDTERFIPLPDQRRKIVKRELGVPEEGFLLLTVRNLGPRMGLDNLVKAMAMVVAKRQDVYLVIGGAGSLETELQSLTFQLGLEPYIRFEGFIPEAKLPQYYQAADLFLLPTRCLEGFGLVTVEALACGTPVLGTPVGGTVEILNGLDPDLLFKSPEPGDIAEKILHFLSLSEMDLRRLREKCRQWVLEHYDWDQIVQQLMVNIRELVNKP